MATVLECKVRQPSVEVLGSVGPDVGCRISGLLFEIWSLESWSGFMA